MSHIGKFLIGKFRLLKPTERTQEKFSVLTRIRLLPLRGRLTADSSHIFLTKSLGPVFTHGHWSKLRTPWCVRTPTLSRGRLTGSGSYGLRMDGSSSA